MFQQSVGNFTSKFVGKEINSVQILNIQNKTSENFMSLFLATKSLLYLVRGTHAWISWCLHCALSSMGCVVSHGIWFVLPHSPLVRCWWVLAKLIFSPYFNFTSVHFLIKLINEKVQSLMFILGHVTKVFKIVNIDTKWAAMRIFKVLQL